jgi:predicted ribosome quality control (RQC) complex YloA/Tae2 family protein
VFDVLTVAAVADELRHEILDGRIQRIGLVDPVTLAAEVYARGQRRALIASADSQAARLLLAESMPSLDSALITPFMLQARKYLRGAVVVRIDQPPLERVVRLSIVKRLPPHNASRSRRRAAADANPLPEEPEEDAGDDEANDLDIYGESEVVHLGLAVEIMGRHSNLILVDASGLVMESVKRVTPRMSRVRPVLPRRPYSLPPPLERPDPRRLTSVGAEALLARAKPNDVLAQTLVRGLRGVSPAIGREIAFRVAEDAAVRVGDLLADSGGALAREVRGLFEPMVTGAWAPRVYERDGVVVDYAAIPMRHLAVDAEEIALERISSAITRAESASAQDGASLPQDHAQRRARLADAVRRERDKAEQRLRSIREQRVRAEAGDRYRRYGELIFSYLWQIEPGDTELAVEDERIPLDPALSPQENAQSYFEQYRKAQRAEDALPEREQAAAAQMGYYEQLLTQIEQAGGFAAIEALREEFEAQTGAAAEGKPQTRSSRSPRRPPPLVSAEGHAIHIGRSGRENDAITFDLAGPDDTWLHARGVPGSHVVIRWLRPGQEEDERTVETAAALAAFYSSARDSGSVEVDVAKRRHVRKIKGAGPGMVTYRNERTIPVHPLDEVALRREGRLV